MFRFEDWMYHRYRTDGYVVFRNILPASLVRDLRREADKARRFVHAEQGPQCQRLQPIFSHGERLDLKPFEDYLDLPVLRDAIHRLLSPEHVHGTKQLLGILVEPVEKPWHMGWHRDGVVELPAGAYDEQVRAALGAEVHDERSWNQVNCALYAESCTWYVPGSHLRLHDLPGEEATPISETRARRFRDAEPVEAERMAMEEVRAMPGAIQVQLQAGDYFVYRNLAWHTGNYLPYQPRATLHDVVQYVGGERPVHVTWHKARQDALRRYRERTPPVASVELNPAPHIPV